ncbi:slit homolog 1 protein-like [Anopheles ziemanni]|uniref:slit homolog 1 protein-like n=1 Tax=Anopheles ziemanni TaxID=345580 RepID=UPI00265E25DC|nr:slit homolog 1 protein-like [Anopheles ziemanni]
MLVDTFSHVELLNLEFLQIERIEHNALANGRNIKELFLSYNNIASLDQGVFDNLITLKAFTMDGNKLASIPNELFKNAKNLKTLSLASNNLQRIGDDSFLHHNQLESVNVTNNQLFHFDLSRIRNLFEADVSHNKLEKLELPSFVEYLDASHNEIKEVIGKIGNNLKDLMLSHNNLSTTAWLKSFTKLVTLDLSHNGIEDITSGDFHQLKQLTKLKLNNNRLFTFDIKDKEIMTSLQILDLSHNELIFVESNYKQFKILHELYLHHNSIVSLKQGQSVAWSKLEKLTLSENDWDCAKMEEFLAMLPPSVAVDYSSEAHCNHASLPQGLCCTRVEMAYHDRLIKKIAEISSYEKFGSNNPLWNNQTKLKFASSSIRTLPKMLVDTFSHVELLNLEFLQIERIEHNALANGRYIRSLHLSYNNIASLDHGVFDNLITLEVFAMDGNKLSSIPNELFKNAKNLIALSLASNNLQRIDDNSFLYNIQLEIVNVTNNQLYHFDLSRIRNLFEADVSHNKLEKLELPSFVEYLDASHNEIKEVIEKKGNTLKDLALSHNNLSTTAWLKSFKKLVTLDLSHNEIEDITSDDFKQLQKLTKLKLNNNRLFTFVIKDADIMTSLQILDLSHNELIFVESNYKQFKILHELYIHHNSIVALKHEKKHGQFVAWSNLEKLTLSENDWDCAKMEEFLAMLPPSVAVDYSSEAHCSHERLPQGLCCTRVEIAYHDRLIKKIAEISSYEKVIRASGGCNVGSLTDSVPNVSSIVSQTGALPSSDLAREVQQLKTEVQRLERDVTEAESYVRSNINKIDALTRIYRVPKTGLPSDTLRNVLDHLEQRDGIKTKETLFRYAEAKAKNEDISDSTAY